MSEPRTFKFRETLTEERREKLLAALRAGNYRNAACAHAGLDYGTFANWMTIAKRPDAPAELSGLRESVLKAEGESVAHLVATIKKASLEQWQAAAWLLERKHAPQWGRRDMSYERAKREERRAQGKALAEIPIEQLEAMVQAEKARRGVK